MQGVGPVTIGFANAQTEGGFTECVPNADLLVLRDLATNTNVMPEWDVTNELRSRLSPLIFVRDVSTDANNHDDRKWGLNGCATIAGSGTHLNYYPITLATGDVPVADDPSITAVLGVATLGPYQDGSYSYQLTINGCIAWISQQIDQTFPGVIATLSHMYINQEWPFFIRDGSRTGVVCRNEAIGDRLLDVSLQTALGYYKCSPHDPLVAALEDSSRPEGYRLLFRKYETSTDPYNINSCDTTCAHHSPTWPTARSSTPVAPYCPRDGSSYCGAPLLRVEGISSAHGNTFGIDTISLSDHIDTCCMYHYYDDATALQAVTGISDAWRLQLAGGTTMGLSLIHI